MKKSEWVLYCIHPLVCVFPVSFESNSHTGGRSLQLCSRTTRAAWPAWTHGNMPTPLPHTHKYTLTTSSYKTQKSWIYDLSLIPPVVLSAGPLRSNFRLCLCVCVCKINHYISSHLLLLWYYDSSNYIYYIYRLINIECNNCFHTCNIFISCLLFCCSNSSVPTGVNTV